MQRVNRVTLPALAFGLALGAGQPLLAQDGAMGGVMSRENWSFSISGGAGYGPVYLGSSKSEAGPLIDLSAEFKDGLFFIGLGGIGITPYQSDRGSFSLSVAYGGGRKVSDDRANLTGLGDIDDEALFLASGSYLFGPVALSADVTTGDTYGTTAKFGLGTQLPVGDRVSISGQVFADWMNDDHAQTYYGVTTAQATASGKPAFGAEGGLSSAGIGLAVEYALSDVTTITVAGEYAALQGDAADSPISVEDSATSVFLSVTRRF